MKPNSPALILLNVLGLFGLFLAATKPALGAEYQNCTTGQNCTIGEFLFDDSYTPDATASCELTSTHDFPDDPATLSATPNGYYSYSFDAGSVEGTYPTKICCTTFTQDYLCLDKTFTVSSTSSGGGSGLTAEEVWDYTDRSITNTSSVAAAVWDNPTRELTGFGTLVNSIWSNSTRSLTTFGSLTSDIWGYSSRSLSNFGNLISDLWSHSSRSLTTTADSATTTLNAASIKETNDIVKANALMLEQLVNKPIIRNFIDESETPNLSEKLKRTQTAAADLFGSVQNIKSRSLTLQEKWPSLSENEIKSELSTLSSLFKENLSQETTLIGTTDWLKTSWNSHILLNLSNQAQAAQSQIDSLINDLDLYGKASRVTSFTPAINSIQKLDDLVGSSLSQSTDLNLFGFIKETSTKIALFDRHTDEGLRILTEIKKDSSQDQSAAATQLSNDILAANMIPQVGSFFQKTTNTNTLTNKILGLLAIIDTNKLLLAGNTGQAIKNIWLEEGSIIFRSVATNPSRSLTQKVTVKYFLPTEVKREQVISHDPELIIEYDSTENALAASGEITLAPLETRTFLVEVEDIWSFRQEEVDSLKNQVNELVDALKNTSYFAQAITIKSDIVVSLEKIMLRQEQAITPENRIRTYRESSLDMNGVEEKINLLKDLVVQSQATGGLLGFVGGIQTVSLWGIVLIIVAGFVFLTYYMSALRSEFKFKKDLPVVSTLSHPQTHERLSRIHYRHRDKTNHLLHKVTRIVIITMLSGGVSSMAVSLALRIRGASTLAQDAPAETTRVLGATENKYPYEATLKIPESGVVYVRSSPSITSPQIITLRENQPIYIFRAIGYWSQIGLSDKDQGKSWWINQQFIQEP